MPWWAAVADVHRNFGRIVHAAPRREGDARAPAARSASGRLRLHHPPAVADRPLRSGSRRSAVQLEREAAGAPAAVPLALRRDSKKETVVAGVNQEHLAQMVGTTRSRINRFMNKFRKLGFIDYNTEARLTVHRPLRTVVLHD